MDVLFFFSEQWFVAVKSFCLIVKMIISHSVAIPLSVDHKPDRSDERERIENAGGFIIWAGIQSKILDDLNCFFASLGGHSQELTFCISIHAWHFKELGVLGVFSLFLVHLEIDYLSHMLLLSQKFRSVAH